jgi:hypothetical protein
MAGEIAFETMSYDGLKHFFRPGGSVSKLAAQACMYTHAQRGEFYAQLRCHSRFDQDLDVDMSLDPGGGNPPVSLLLALHTQPIFATRGSVAGFVQLVEPGFVRAEPINVDDMMYQLDKPTTNTSLLFEMLIGEIIIASSRQGSTVRDAWPTCFDGTPLVDLRVKASFTLRKMGCKFGERENALDANEVQSHLARYPSGSTVIVVLPSQWAPVLAMIGPGVVVQFADKSSSCDILWKVPMDATNERFALVLFQAKFYQARRDNGIDNKMLREEVEKAAAPLVASLDEADMRHNYPEIWFVFVATNLGRLLPLRIDSTTAVTGNTHLEAVQGMARTQRFGVLVWNDAQLEAFFGTHRFRRLRERAH